MARPIAYNRNKLHALFYTRSNHRHVLAMNQRMYAMEAGISVFHFNRIIADFLEEGRMKRMSDANHRLQTFLVHNPVDYLEAHHDPDGAYQAQQALDYLVNTPRARNERAAYVQELFKPTVDNTHTDVVV